MMRFLVIGAGALGGYFGAHLIQGGADVEFLVRPKRAAQLAERGLVIIAPEGSSRVLAKTVLAGQIEPSYDVILLCCKAYDLDEAINALAPAISERSAILPVLNGVKHVDILTDRFGPGHVLGGLTFVNAALTPDGDIVRSAVSMGGTTFGELDGSTSDRCTAIQQAFAAGGLSANASDAIIAAMWAKFPAVAIVAALATLCRSRAGAIAAAPGSAGLIAALIDEAGKIAAAEKYPLPASIIEIVRRLYSDPNSTYGPSMLVDMEQDFKTEGEHIIGDMVDRAERHGLSAPVLTAARCNLQVYEKLRANK